MTILAAEPLQRMIDADKIHLPTSVAGGTFRTTPPLIRASKLTSRSNGGVGKQLSDGWSLNFAVGCTHGCPFCYVDEIHKRFGQSRYGEVVLRKWGDYLLLPGNLDDAIEKTPWRKWAGKEVMMSSTHDPYLPTLAATARKLLEHALPAGVKICLQTRSFIVTKDLEFLARYRGQIRLQVSIATMDRDFARLIEPRVPSPEARLEVLRQAREAGLDVGVILAPIFPPLRIRPDVVNDLKRSAEALKSIRPNHIYGESLHVRGQNLRLLKENLGESVQITPGFDTGIAKVFHQELQRVGLKGTWWYENRG